MHLKCLCGRLYICYCLSRDAQNIRPCVSRGMEGGESMGEWLVGWVFVKVMVGVAHAV